jgi:hypothetical protein
VDSVAEGVHSRIEKEIRDRIKRKQEELAAVDRDLDDEPPLRGGGRRDPKMEEDMRKRQEREANRKLKENARRRADRYHSRLSSAKVATHHATALKGEIEDLYSLEVELHDRRSEIGDSFPEVRHIDDYAERRALLDAARATREKKRETLELLRNKITDKRNFVEERLDKHERGEL